MLRLLFSSKRRISGVWPFLFILTCTSLIGCSDPKYGLKELDVVPKWFCTGEAGSIHAKFGTELDKIVVKDAFGVPRKVFKDTDEINWTTPALNRDIIQFKIRGHLSSWGTTKRKTFTSEFVRIDDPTWTSPLKDVHYSSSQRVEIIEHNAGTGPVPADFGYYVCSAWDIVEHEECDPIEDCADECWTDENGNFVCEYVCHVVGEDCYPVIEEVCVAEEFVNESYREHQLYVKLDGLTWQISPEAFSGRAGTLQMRNDNDFIVTAASNGWNATLDPGAAITTPDVHPGQLSVSGTIDPPVERLCATDFTLPGHKASFDDASCDFEGLIGGVSLEVYCRTTP
jgi:hypothetical protein